MTKFKSKQQVLEDFKRRYKELVQQVKDEQQREYQTSKENFRMPQTLPMPKPRTKAQNKQVNDCFIISEPNAGFQVL